MTPGVQLIEEVFVMVETYEPEPGLVVRLSPELSGKQRRFLRGLAHPLQPVVQVGQRGMSENLVENVEAQLLAHELIKVKVHDSSGIEAIAEELHKRTGAQLAQKIGHMLVFYKARAEDPELVLP